VGLWFVTDSLMGGKDHLRTGPAGQGVAIVPVEPDDGHPANGNHDCHILLHSNSDSMAKETGKTIISIQIKKEKRKMIESRSKLTSILSSIIIILTVIAAGSGLFFPDVYRDNAINNAFNKAGLYGNDLVTFIIAVPLLMGALIFAGRGSLRARLIWLGMIYYILYNYTFYLFGVDINWFFPLYGALFILPIVVLVFALSNTDINGLSQNFRPAKSIRWVSGYMFFFTALLLIVWTAEWVSFVATGSLDAEKGNFIRTVAGMDMLLLASGMLLGAVWLWKRQPWGYVVATILNVNFTIYALVLAVGSYTQATAGVEGAAASVPLWIFLGMACLASSLILLGNLQPAKQVKAVHQ
jgi:hypothetical protein